MIVPDFELLGEGRRRLRLPCGSLLSVTTNSVPLPVSELNASSDIIRADRATSSLQ